MVRLKAIWTVIWAKGRVDAGQATKTGKSLDWRKPEYRERTLADTSRLLTERPQPAFKFYLVIMCLTHLHRGFRQLDDKPCNHYYYVYMSGNFVAHHNVVHCYLGALSVHKVSIRYMRLIQNLTAVLGVGVHLPSQQLLLETFVITALFSRLWRNWWHPF